MVFILEYNHIIRRIFGGQSGQNFPLPLLVSIYLPSYPPHLINIFVYNVVALARGGQLKNAQILRNYVTRACEVKG